MSGNYGQAAVSGLLDFGGPIGKAAGLAVPAMAGMVKKINIADIGFDPRFDPRSKELSRILSTSTNVDVPENAFIPKISLSELEGKPFVTSMSDRTAAGSDLLKINDVALNAPVRLRGGQGFMFENPGMVWASGKSPVKQIMSAAEKVKSETGQNPIYLPWRMAPTGGDFAYMTGETMLRYADSNMSKSAKGQVNKSIKQLIPGFKGISTEEGINQFIAAPDSVRKQIINNLDVNFRDVGGLNIGQARVAVTDPNQLTGKDANLMAVGEIFAGSPVISKSGHPSYPFGVPGRGLGLLNDEVGVFELLPQVVRERAIPNPIMPRQTDTRALQMKPYTGVITEDILREIERRKGL
jgi:hypothetical protein